MKSIAYFRIAAFAALIIGFCLLPEARAQITASATVTATDTATSSVIADFDWKENNIADSLEKIQAFQNHKSEFETTIKNLAYVDNIKTDFEEIQTLLDEAYGLFVKKRQVSSWDIIRAGDFKSDRKQLFESAEKVKTNYSAYLTRTEKIISELNETLSVLKKFHEYLLKDSSLASHKSTVVQVKKDVDDLLAQIRTGRKEYTTVFQDNKELLDAVTAFSDEIDNEITLFKKERFSKTAPALYESDFFTRFTQDLMSELRAAWRDVFAIDRADFIDNRYFIVQSLIVFILVWLGLREIKRFWTRKALYYPPLWAALAALFYAAVQIERPPLLWVMFFWLVLSALCLFIFSRIINEPKGRRDVAILILAYTVLQIVERLGVPLVLYRLFLVAIALGLATYCRIRIKDIAGEKQVHLRQSLLRLLSFIFLVSAGAEFFGFHLFASFLVHAAVKTTFIVFVFWNLRELTRLSVDVVLAAPWVARFDFTRYHRELIGRRIHWLMTGFIAFAALAMLASVWGLYDGISQAVAGILDLGWQYRENRFTLGTFFQAVLIFAAIRFVGFVLCNVLEEEVFPRRKITIGSGKAISSLIEYSLWIMAFVVAFTVLGFDLKQLAIIAGALSVGIGFGLQNIVNNFVAGLILLFERPVRVGDILEFRGQWGTVEKVGLRSTVVRTLVESELIIPNSDLITQPVCNMTLANTLYVVIIPFSVAYGTDPEKIKSLVIELALANPGVIKDPAPEVFFTKMADSSLEFELRARVIDARQRVKVSSELLGAVYSVLRTQGIEIPYPQRVLHVRTDE